MMKSELLEAQRTPVAATLSADTDSRNKEMTGSLGAYVDYVDGKLSAEIATSIREAGSERDELHGALKSALELHMSSCALMSGSAFFRIMWDLVCGRRSSMQKAVLNDRTPSRTV